MEIPIILTTVVLFCHINLSNGELSTKEVAKLMFQPQNCSAESVNHLACYEGNFFNQSEWTNLVNLKRSLFEDQCKAPCENGTCKPFYFYLVDWNVVPSSPTDKKDFLQSFPKELYEILADNPANNRCKPMLVYFVSTSDRFIATYAPSDSPLAGTIQYIYDETKSSYTSAMEYPILMESAVAETFSVIRGCLNDPESCSLDAPVRTAHYSNKRITYWESWSTTFRVVWVIYVIFGAVYTCYACCYISCWCAKRSGGNDRSSARVPQAVTKSIKKEEKVKELTEMTNEIKTYKDKVQILQNQLIKKNDKEKSYAKLQQVHTAQQTLLMNYQDKTDKCKHLEEIVRAQEKVIAKMEKLMQLKERTLKDAAVAPNVTTSATKEEKVVKLTMEQVD